MGNWSRYSSCAVYVDGTLLAEEATVNMRRMSNSNQVLTVAKGYAGESPGAPMVEIEIENAVPSADFELTGGKFMLQLNATEITLFAAGKTFTSKGAIIEDNFTHGVNASAGLSLKFRGAFDADWA